MDLEHRIITLETKISYQDHFMQSLNEVIIAQQNQIDAMENNIQRMRDYLAQNQAESLAQPDEETPPPHY